jgi:hypothetical protein
MNHVADSQLALFSSGDLPGWQRLKTSVHVRSCDECRAVVEAYRSGRNQLRTSADDLPEGLDWDRLSAEMTANIHLGLAAGECVSPRDIKSSSWAWDWKPVAAVFGVVLVLVTAWLLNIPRGDTEALQRVFSRIATSGPFGSPEEPGPMVQASQDGIQFRENGTVMGVAFSDASPVTVTVSNTGASARYVDSDTDQVMITTVYVQ